MTWFQTFSRVKFDLLEPSARMVRATDLARSLSQICRFNGHTRTHWSVAQHSVIVAAAAWFRTRQRDVAAMGALHDAREAYVGDVTSPVKAALHALGGGVAFRQLETGVHRAIVSWAEIPDAVDAPAAWATVKEIDLSCLFHDRDHVAGRPIELWEGEGSIEPLDARHIGDVPGGAVWNPLTTPWSAPVAETAFLYALAATIPDVVAPSHPFPPPWLFHALRVALPRVLGV